jgi:hypothetical protein
MYDDYMRLSGRHALLIPILMVRRQQEYFYKGVAAGRDRARLRNGAKVGPSFEGRFGTEPPLSSSGREW